MAKISSLVLKAKVATAAATAAAAQKPAVQVATAPLAQLAPPRSPKPAGKQPELADSSGCVTPPAPNIPGAVINNPNNNSDLYIDNDPDDFYFDLVFQKQTYLEKLRAKYEGKMIVLAWPKPYDIQSVIGFEGDVDDETNDLTNDKVFWVRMMINGFWKQVVDTKVFRLYAAINGYDIGKLSVSDEESLTDLERFKLLYGEKGLINLLVEAGGITVLADDGNASPVWNDFPHITDADRLDFCEYKKYLDHYNNGGAPFEIDILKPYEPAGSNAYYLPSRLEALSEQVRRDLEFAAIRIQLNERWRRLASSVESKNKIIESLCISYTNRLNDRLGTNSELLQIFTSRDPWVLYKKSIGSSFIGYTSFPYARYKQVNNLFSLLDELDWQLIFLFPYKFEQASLDQALKTLAESAAVSATLQSTKPKNVFETAGNGLLNFAKNDVLNFTRNTNGFVDNALNFVENSIGINTPNLLNLFNGSAQTQLNFIPDPLDKLLSLGAKIIGSEADDVIDNGSAKYVQLPTNTRLTNRRPGILSSSPIGTSPRLGNTFTFPKLDNGELAVSVINDSKLITTMVYDRVQDRINELNLITRAKQADSMVQELRDDIQQCRDFLLDIDESIVLAESVESIKVIYDKLAALQEDLDDMTDQDIEFCNTVYKDIDKLFISHIELLYDSVQEFRRKIYESRNSGLPNRYYIAWPKSVIEILNRYIPQKVNYNLYLS